MDIRPLHAFAHARAGDKGNSVNISVIPYHAGAYEYVLAEVTEERVRNLLGHRAIGAVKRYEVPGLPALNFVIEDALGGRGQPLSGVRWAWQVALIPFIDDAGLNTGRICL